MQQSEKELFIQIYNRYLETNEREASISFVKLTPTQKRDTINMINTLEEYGYIQCTARASGFYQVKLTLSGMDFAQKELSE